MTNWEMKERMILLSHCTHIDRFHGSHAARIAHIEIQTPYRFTANFIQYMRSIASFRTIIFLRIDIERKNWKKNLTQTKMGAHMKYCARGKDDNDCIFMFWNLFMWFFVCALFFEMNLMWKHSSGIDLRWNKNIFSLG